MLHDIRRIEENRKILTEEKIQAIYRTLEDDLNAFIAKEYRKYADENGQLYMSYLDSKRQRAKFLQEIVENVDNITPELKKTLTSLVNKTYEECYKGMAETVTQAATAENIAEVGKTLSVRPETLKRAVENNISKLTLPQVLQKHRAEVIYQIQQELNIGLINGDRYERMANRISERVGVSMSKARNIVRTESHRNIESGMMDCAENIDKKLDGSDLIYAATWKTMKDSRVRPQVMRRTKHGWKHGYSKNGADHMKMEGVTVRVGELFDLGGGVKTKAPSQSGVAAHDCNCRCYLSYNLMTVEEFAKATGQSVESVRKKYDKPEPLTQSAEDYYAESVKKEPQITEALRSAVDNTDAALVGLDYRLKTKDSYRRKVKKEVLDVQEKVNARGLKYTVTENDVISNMRDVVRYTCLSDKTNFINNYKGITDDLSKKGYSVVRVKNTFKPNAPYKGINTIIQDSNGYNFELQFHTKQSFDLKNGILHELYEKERLVTTPEAEKELLRKKMKEISDSIVFPDDIGKIIAFDNLPDILDKITK